MNEDQFLLLQESVQWAADEADLEGAGIASGDIRWQQGSWARGMANGQTKGHPGYRNMVSCGSSCCVAGTAVRLVGAKFLVGPTTYQELDGAYRTAVCLTSDGNIEDIEGYATRILGLEKSEASLLFGGSGTIDQVINYATMIAYNRGFTLHITRKGDQ